MSECRVWHVTFRLPDGSVDEDESGFFTAPDRATAGGFAGELVRRAWAAGVELAIVELVEAAD